MLSRLRMSMMIVVPAFAEGEQCHPKTVFGSVAGEEALRSPNVGGGVYQPGNMQANHGAQENSPQHKWDAAYGQQHQAQHSQRDPMPITEPCMNFVFAQVGDVRQ